MWFLTKLPIPPRTHHRNTHLPPPALAWGVMGHGVGMRGVDRMTYLKPLPPAGPRNHHPDGNQAGHALTLKLDHSMGPTKITNQLHYRSMERFN